MLRPVCTPLHSKLPRRLADLRSAMGAHLAQLRLAGFKSFADPATLDILPGLVDPNGCGKSNLAEALRWAMGKGRAGALRGDAMDDLIFAGTKTCPGRNAAEVTLTLEGRFPPSFADETRLRVARYLGRGSDSAYQVNGAEVRAQPCCMEQTCRRSYPIPAWGSGDADGDRASQLQHAVERMDGDVHLGRPALRANDSETLSPREFSLEGAEG